MRSSYTWVVCLLAENARVSMAMVFSSVAPMAPRTSGPRMGMNALKRVFRLPFVSMPRALCESMMTLEALPRSVMVCMEDRMT